jgi:hypothetical protein
VLAQQFKANVVGDYHHVSPCQRCQNTISGCAGVQFDTQKHASLGSKGFYRATRYVRFGECKIKFSCQLDNYEEIIMSSTVEKKSSLPLDKKAETGEAGTTSSDAGQHEVSQQKNLAEELREAIRALDVERTELVKKTIENIKPGRPFDSSVIREINKIETKKNRLIVARFATLLKKNGPGVQAIVHQIIEI